MTERRSDPSQLQSVLRGLNILEIFIEEQRDVTLAEVCLRLGLAKSTGVRFLNTLVGAGYLERAAAGRYRLGPNIGRLSPRTIEQQLRRVASPFIQELVAAYGESVHLGVRQSRTMVTVSFTEGTHAIRMASHVGARRPIHCSSMGKALLAYSEPGVIEEVLAAPLESLTERTVATPDALRGELGSIRNQRYSVDDEEVEQGMRCIGAPVFDYSGQAIAGISISGPTSRLTVDRAKEVGPAIRSLADRLSVALGWEPRAAGGTLLGSVAEWPPAESVSSRPG